ncbi:glycosyltransferase family 2 protein [Desemzia sp. RIT804]|uniref:glycosyltransferase family 2 protein n=1 Tax=Desemzia sp. RIT 804 TaxID=2810209 RepID=UPI00194E2703|nr:glycosyltransferase family 2 protein [Desemzia sp. RIT 804]MBM6613564.1 glycosyltransferase family 2 protein [Desemzia sp. RIT 804]
MITILVPVQNVEKSLLKCLHSIRNQTYRNLQIILINNGSVDQSGNICDKFAKNDPRFTVIHTESKSLSATKNTGLSQALGEYVCFVNAVDWINAEMMEELVVSIEAYKGDIVTCRYYEDTISELFIVPGPIETRLMSKNEAIQLCLAQTRVHGFLCNKLYKLELFHSYPTIRFDEEVDYYEDLLVAMQCFFKSQTIVYSPPPHYHYYLSQHLPISVLKNKGKLTGLKALKKAIDLLAQDPSIDTQLLKDYYAHLILSSLFLLVTVENVHDPLITNLRKYLSHYDLSDLQDSDLKRCAMITRRNIGLGKIYWDMFYKNKFTE